MVAVVKRLHHHSIRPRRHVGDLAGLNCVGGERLLAQHVLAGVECGASPSAVQPVRQRVVDRIQVRVGDQRLVAVVHSRDLVFSSKCPSPGAVACGYRDHRNLRVVLRRFDERRWGDASRAQHADSQWFSVFRHGPKLTPCSTGSSRSKTNCLTAPLSCGNSPIRSKTESANTICFDCRSGCALRLTRLFAVELSCQAVSGNWHRLAGISGSTHRPR